MRDYMRWSVNILVCLLLILFLFGGNPISIHDAIVIRLICDCKTTLKPEADPLLRLRM